MRIFEWAMVDYFVPAYVIPWVCGGVGAGMWLYMCNGAVVKGQDTGSGVNQMETTAGVWQQSGFTCSAADNFQHTQNPHAHT